MKRFKNILYINEESVAQNKTIASAVALAERNQADLTVIDVIPVVTAGIGMKPGGSISNDLQAFMLAEHRKKLESLTSAYSKRLDIKIDVLVGVKFIEAIRAVLVKGYDLLIKPAENPSYIERLFGSDDMHLLRKCPCPVWLMTPEETSDYDCIVAAVDVSPYGREMEQPNKLNQDIVELASSIALTESASLHIVHAWDAPEAGFVSLWQGTPEKTEEKYNREVQAQHEAAMNELTGYLHNHIGEETYKYLSPKVHLRKGAVKQLIPEIARNLKADLIVMGTVARTGIPGLIIGNTAEAILDQLQCSVLAIKPPGFVCPVKLD